MLQPPDRCNSLRLYWSAPLEIDKVEDEQVIQPVLAVSSTEDEHHVLDYAGGVELSHGRFAANDARDIEGEFLNTLFQIDENHV